MHTFHAQSCTISSLYDRRPAASNMYGDDDVSGKAVIIDPVLDFDVMAGATSAKCRPSAGFPCA
jgi:hypothetical protein